jgi:hypothetical protein
MSLEQKLGHLRNTLVSTLQSFEGKRKQNKRRAFMVYLGATMLSALVTVLLGLQGVADSKLLYIRNGALILSATVTVLTAFDTFFNHRALWVRYTQTVSHLRALQTELEYISEDHLSEAQLDSLFQRMQEILANTNEWWQQERTDKSPKSKVVPGGVDQGKPPKPV